MKIGKNGKNSWKKDISFFACCLNVNNFLLLPKKISSVSYETIRVFYSPSSSPSRPARATDTHTHTAIWLISLEIVLLNSSRIQYSRCECYHYATAP